ncbi:patatin-like phospholipase family protein [Vallitalea pronyensis]|uniref:Patatin-like phospholipase family protein n=1 Tax=Vallitalea pronyensis TaxID=1348613 RepID=A0A8J8MLD4_9FIRM|nr:patatin-like phospholipase family protein [Vallitalea pronyensis]QUI23614.1 patatin-like phospholipase family protein [Vallitalea pronyensis]
MRIGLVLSGGGGKGAYQIGAWKAFEEFNLKFDVVAGTSIGAINTLLMASVDVNKAADIWLNMEQKIGIQSSELMSKLTLQDYNSVYTAFMDPSYCEQLVSSASKFDETCIQDGIYKLLNTANKYENFYVCSTQVSKTPTAEFFNIMKMDKEKAKNAILSSTSIPGIFSAVYIGNHYYVDGGVTNNVPLEPVIQSDCDLIIAIVLDLKDMNLLKINSAVPIVPIIPSQSLGDFKTGVLNLKKADVEMKMSLGYTDTTKLLSSLKTFI